LRICRAFLCQRLLLASGATDFRESRPAMTNETASNQRRLPDPEICRTRCLGPTLYISECLVQDPYSCEFAVRFGSANFCRHPDRRSFENTGGATLHPTVVRKPEPLSGSDSTTTDGHRAAPRGSTNSENRLGSSPTTKPTVGSAPCDSGQVATSQALRLRSTPASGSSGGCRRA
jgi:hypothetical protein